MSKTEARVCRRRLHVLSQLQEPLEQLVWARPQSCLQRRHTSSLQNCRAGASLACGGCQQRRRSPARMDGGREGGEAGSTRLHDDVHVRGVLVRALEVHDVERAAQAREHVHLALDVVQVRGLRAAAPRERVQG